MKCTACKKGTLVPSHIEHTLISNTCNNCGGNWILLSNYLHWLNEQDEWTADSITEEDITTIEDTTSAILCPATGRIMLKYHISAETPHKIDLSPEANGIWLDKGEWDLLKQHQLQYQLNAIFTEPWQHKVKKNRTKDIFSAMYLNELGINDYQKIQEIKQWISSNTNKQKLLAYLLTEDPYSAGRY